MNSNLNKSINVALAIIMIAMFYVVGTVVLSSIDKVTARDCARGITSACQYVK
jgi:hypothetical protein